LEKWRVKDASQFYSGDPAGDPPLNLRSKNPITGVLWHLTWIKLSDLVSVGKKSTNAFRLAVDHVFKIFMFFLLNDL
jgi:hypothetical protein